jgi:predicted Zn-dependent protease
MIDRAGPRCQTGGWWSERASGDIGAMVTLLRLAAIVLVGLVAIGVVSRLRTASGPGGPGEATASSGVSLDLDSVRQARAAIRSRIEGSSTYLGHSLQETDSMLRRWPRRDGQPLRIWVAPATARGYTAEHGQAARSAFRRWERVGAIPVVFDYVRDSAQAEVVVRWIESFPMDRTGQADVVWDQDGWIRSSVLTLATHAKGRWPVSPEAAYTVALHEIGHLLGLGHSDEPEDLMYRTTGVQDLTARDRRTSRLLYALPPGSLRDP